MKNICLFILLAILVSNCKDEAVNPPAETKIYFKGITETDHNAWPITVDSTDWRTDDVWLKQESDLFTQIHQSGCAQSYDNKVHQYPNPSIGIFNLVFEKSAETRLELRLVDKSFILLYSNDSILGNHLVFDSKVFAVKDTLRLYYKFIENNCEFMGHGDILIQ